METAVRRLGYDITEPGKAGRKSSIFRIDDMDCIEEFKPIHGKLDGVPGVIEVTPDYVARNLRVVHDSDTIDEESIREHIKQTGFEARLVRHGTASVASPVRRKKLILTVVSGILFGTGLLLWALGVESAYSVVCYAGSIVIGGAYIARGAYYSARNFSFDMNFLMTVAVIGAAVIGEWTEGAATVFLFSVALLLETFSLDRARDAIKSLMQLAPESATIRTSEGEKNVPVENVAVGDTVIVHPGDKVPLDGIVTSGTSEVDQSPITGESMPVLKESGAEVFAGSFNRQGVLQIEVTREVRDSTLSRIAELVEEAQAKRAASQSFIDRFASIYTPVVILLSVATCLVPWLLLGGEFQVWFYRALVILVISCPCALVISTPVTMVCALGQAARNGVLIKGGLYLETAAKLDTIVFDKTGTLTTGAPSVTGIAAFGSVTEKDLLKAAASAEANSEHHLGRAIVEEARRRNIEFEAAQDFAAVPGMGAVAVISGREWLVGSERMMKEKNVDFAEAREAAVKFESEGRTTVLVATDGAVVGTIAISDTIRTDAPLALQRLRSFGIGGFAMLTGDNEGAARAIASKLGIERWEAGLLPQDKVSAIEKMAASGGNIAMVGDGVNDAPALAASSLGVAMGAGGSDTALETADVALMADDLTKLTYAVRIGRRAVSIIGQNIALALSLKLAFLALALLGLANLWMAVLADMGASLVVVFNGMRALLLKHLPRENRGEQPESPG